MKNDSSALVRYVLCFSLLVMAVISSPASATFSSEPYTGSICLTAASFCPNQYAEARGQLLPIAENTALFSLIGTTYGGNGTQTFGLPDLQGQTPVGLGNGSGLFSVGAGQTRGTETTTLMSANLAPHSHLAASVGGAGSATIWSEALTFPFL